MKTKAIIAILALLLVFQRMQAQTSTPTPCPDLKNLVLANTTITIAESLTAGPHPSPVGTLSVPIYRVAATIKPSNDSNIQIEVWMPATGWNGKFQGVGNGTFLGSITYDKLMRGVEDGYATASTDTGHIGGEDDVSWALGHPEKVTDFAYRAVHEMTLKAKSITQAFYGSTLKQSYWVSCSSGGKQGLKEAQLYPTDYDGIVAGDPVNNHSHEMGAALYIATTTFKNSSDAIPQSKFTMINNAGRREDFVLNSPPPGPPRRRE
jgi:feruloyl esterase